jgi:hypothetical protein
VPRRAAPCRAAPLAEDTSLAWPGPAQPAV